MAKHTNKKHVEYIKDYYASGKDRFNRELRQETYERNLPKVIAGKKRRLITRLHQVGLDGTESELISVLRTRLRPYTVKSKSGFRDYRTVLIEAIGGTDANYKTKRPHSEHK